MEKGTIRSLSGVQIDVFNPTEDMIVIEDIAHSLSNQCRFGGHVPRFYSVAQHCVMASRRSKGKKKFPALMHDTAEFILLDMPSPIKKGIPQYKKMENKVLKVLSKKFGFEFPFPPEIKEVDTELLAEERENLFSMNPKFPVWGHKKAKNEFLKAYNKLKIK